MTDFTFRIEFPHSGRSPESVKFKPGIHVVYGESGVGKSELCRRLVISRSSRTGANFVVEDVSRSDRPMLVSQDPDDQIVAPTVSRELAFNLENIGWSSSRIQRRMAEIINLAGIDWNLDRHPYSLSGGERQILNLATALSVRPDLLVIDDGLAFLSDSNKQRFTTILRDYGEQNEAVIVWVTSDLQDVSYGNQAWELGADSLSRRVSTANSSLLHGLVPPGRAYLRIEGMTFGYDGTENSLFRNQTLTVGPFRSLAVLGDNGSGKTTLGRLLSGLVHPEEGSIVVELTGQDTSRIGFLPQFPERLFGGRTVLELSDELRENGLFPDPGPDTLVRMVEEFGMSNSVVGHDPIHFLDVPVIRVALTLMICLAEYDLVILDEPLFGLGITQRDKLLDRLRTFLSQKHLIFITHSPSVAASLCDHAVTTDSGTLTDASLENGAVAGGHELSRVL